MMVTDRRAAARKLLEMWRPGDYAFLGEGCSGVVFHDGKLVFKVHLARQPNFHPESDTLAYLHSRLGDFANRKHFAPLAALDLVDGVWVLSYPFEHGTPVDAFLEDELVSFLAECWETKVIFRNIPTDNFVRRVDGSLLLVDYEPERFTDELFANMIARAHIHLCHGHLPPDRLFKLRRAAINNLDLPELDGIEEFARHVFDEVLRRQCRDVTLPPSATGAESTTWPRRPVTLLIKCCRQDAVGLYACVTHLVRQLEGPDLFGEKLLVVDDCRTQGFVRQFQDADQTELFEAGLARLGAERVVDRIVRCGPDVARAVNRRWFGLDVEHTHTTAGAPVVPHLHGIDCAEFERILQFDVDVMIGRHDRRHSFLADMQAALDAHPQALSVAFGIKHAGSSGFQQYFGFDPPSFVPEVRACLLDRSRLLRQAPLPNSASPDGLALTWYRSAERLQAERGLVSLRGGDFRSFFVHPQNYRKGDPYVWLTILDRVEQLAMPAGQDDEPELQASFPEWCRPKRGEDLVVVSLLPPEDCIIHARRLLASLLSQTDRGWGLVLIDNHSEGALSPELRDLVAPISARTTLLCNRLREPSLAVTERAVRHFVDNPDSFVLLLDGSSALLGNTVIASLKADLANYGADFALGKEWRIRGLGLHVVDFLHPRREGNGLDRGFQCFRRRLLNALGPYDFRYRRAETVVGNEFVKMSRQYEWLPDHRHLGLAVPLVEVSRNPIRTDHVNCMPSRVEPGRAAAFWSHAVALPSREGAVIPAGRKRFRTSLDRVEIDITYACNLHCRSCNRSCSQAPTSEMMSLDQVKTFLDEARELQRAFALVNILGGEPTLHPHFAEIVREISRAFPPGGPTTIQITSNGTSEALAVLDRVVLPPNAFVDRASFKTGPVVDYFAPFNDAPMDDPRFRDADFGAGCWVTAYCGFGLNRRGYYACSAAGGIDRVLGLGLGHPNLADFDEAKARFQRARLCRYCGNFKHYAEAMGDFIPRSERAPYVDGICSPSWRQAYASYRAREADVDGRREVEP
ncbi:MAG: radical SAM protein [Deltaproteobacteria bacterium]|nr:radical SAM protein [Deltaproteobacteria bacterium]